MKTEILLNKIGGGLYQEKTITPTSSQQIVLPDDGYDALEQVIIDGYKLQAKSVTPTSSSQTITPDSGYNGLSQVTVGASSGSINIKNANLKGSASVASGKTYTVTLSQLPRLIYYGNYNSNGYHMNCLWSPEYSYGVYAVTTSSGGSNGYRSSPYNATVSSSKLVLDCSGYSTTRTWYWFVYY